MPPPPPSPPPPRVVVYKDGSRSFSLLPIFHRKMRHYILICLVCSAIQFEVSVTDVTLASGLQALERVLVSRRIHWAKLFHKKYMYVYYRKIGLTSIISQTTRTSALLDNWMSTCT